MSKRVVILLYLMLLVLPLAAQTRITADKRMKNLGSTNSAFTLRDRKRLTDLKGLRKSEYTGAHHSLGVYFYGGYASVASSSDIVNISLGGYNLRFGGLYEYRYGYFTFQTGLGIMCRDIKSDLRDYTYTNLSMAEAWDSRWAVIADSWGMKIDKLTYSITERQDILTQMYAQIPVKIGINFYGLYGLIGVSVSAPFMQKASTSMLVSTTGSYSRYLGLGDDNHWAEMDNHGYRHLVPLKRNIGNMPFRMDFCFTAEAGYDFNIGKLMHLRTALFADMSLNSVSAPTNDRSLYIPFESKWDFETFEAHPVWYSDVVNNKFTHHFSAGIKLTLLYTFPQSDKCILCSQNHGKAPRRR